MKCVSIDLLTSFISLLNSHDPAPLLLLKESEHEDTSARC
jgi:hypothetical protein